MDTGAYEPDARVLPNSRGKPSALFLATGDLTRIPIIHWPREESDRATLHNRQAGELRISLSRYEAAVLAAAAAGFRHGAL